jgi:hypothetical protein
VFIVPDADDAIAGKTSRVDSRRYIPVENPEAVVNSLEQQFVVGYMPDASRVARRGSTPLGTAFSKVTNRITKLREGQK